MWLPWTSASFTALAGTAIAQNTVNSKFCDPLTSICYSSHTTSNGISYRLALPNVTAAPFDAIFQIVSPIKYGWAGFSWGGSMAYVPLTIGWPNGTANSTSSNAVYSSRMAFGLSLPQPYDAAEYTYLKGSGVNSTHWTLTVLCKGCSSWTNVDGGITALDPTNTSQPFANAYAAKPPLDPKNNASAFNVHDLFDHWTLDLGVARSTSFNRWVSSNLLGQAPPTASSALPISSTSPTPSTFSSSIIRTSSAPVGPTGVPSSCSGLTPKFSDVTAKGWKATKVGGDLSMPRGLIFDTAGNLLIIENGKGITAFTVGPDGCIKSNKTVITQRNLNHGIALSADGKTLYASSTTKAFAWAYNPANMSVSGSATTIVQGMYNGGHTTRTLIIPPKSPNLLLVSHGSNDNNDYAAGNIKVGRSSVKAFDLTNVPSGGYNYASGGYQLGYGLRNSVGLDFDANGMLWGVDNGSDEVQRTINNKAVDVHFDNPADELNYIGDPTKPNTQWYGYPTCHTIWEPKTITDKAFTVGDQFVYTPNATFDDDACKKQATPARLAIPAHAAPLDSKFNLDSSALYVTHHGSWDRNPPNGFKLVSIPFTKGTDGNYAPKASVVNSNSSFDDIWWNADLSKCSTTFCFRPVSIAVDKLGRLYVTSDSSGEGELFIVGRT